ncbi:rod shape-determining protein MreC [Candidatus Arthromitus sp. SFB-rat-Yit]|uniref:rod shape-determining protein MreC n=1 Tax=Candidatus Arthromitus sp. SFB-rat-Yit TaxID=1041504 RepID=UPI000227A3D9|nr:rod shape-determining protein MreC [Candidatus Arthromitus sp. SFB-rat-Yit]BAK80890.1 rod shape-determining protein MreC [Candidatus Arthromitus sp. SFB-rat-Yit]
MKFIKNKINLIISLLVIIMIVLILFSSQRSSKSYIEGVTGDIMNPVQKVIYSVSKYISDTYYGMIHYSELTNKVKELVEENGELKSKIIDYSGLKEENDKLRDVLNLKDRLEDYTFIGANIIGRNDVHSNNYIVDVGMDDGLEKGMIVVANGGLFGMITSVSSNWSIVSPINNGSISIGGIVKRTNGSNGIVKKYKNSVGNYVFKMEYLPIDEDVVEGDIIITSGLGGVYPYGVVIGEVISIEDDKRNLSKSILIKSHVDFDFVNNLFIVTPKNKYKVEY